MGQKADPLGEFIAQNQGAWDQRYANYQQAVGAFSGTGAVNRSNDVMLAAGPGYTGGIGSGGSDRDAQIARMLELANRPESMGSQPMFRVEVNGVGSTGMDDRPSTTGGYLPSMYPDPQLVGSGVNAQGLRYFDYDTDARSIQVKNQSVLTAQALGPLSANAAELSARASDQRFYNDQIANATNPWSAIGYTYLRALNNAGHDIADGVKGVYTLATDANARASVISGGINAIAHPIDTATGLYNAGSNYLRSTSGAQMAEDALRFAAGGLATAGAGKGVVIVGDAAGSAAVATGRALAPKALEMAENFAYRTGSLSYVVEPGPSLGRAASTVSGADAVAVTANVGRNTVTWVVDSNGTTLSASGTLRETFSGARRSAAEVQAQNNVASSGVLGDQGGHTVGHRFVLDQGEINMFPQNSNFNNSAYKTLENDYARYTRQGYQVDFDHAFENFNSAGRPGAMVVQFEVTNSAGVVVDSWSGRFFNQAGQNYVRRAF